ncbi:MAG: DUF2798 domain-containing protein [Phycisphaerales bacterium]|jgi:hypothetical protein
MAAPRRGDFLFLFLMLLVGTGGAAFALAFTRLGFGAGLLHEWLRQWGIAFVAALVACVLAGPTVRAVVAWVTR